MANVVARNPPSRATIAMSTAPGLARSTSAAATSAISEAHTNTGKPMT
jgi:hypothetical protein